MLVLLFLVACQTVPITGRRTLSLLPESNELQMGLTAYQEILKKSTLSTDRTLIDQVTRVGRRIAAATGRDDFAWEFAVIEDKPANAFCLPGGKVAVYTGILPITRMIYMAKAGYHPSAARDLWVRMGEASSGPRPPEFLSTHPSPETRIQQIEAWLPEAMTHYRPR